MSHLALSFLGHPAIHLNGAEVLIGRTKAIALLAYLAVTHQRHAACSA